MYIGMQQPGQFKSLRSHVMIDHVATNKLL